MKEKILSILEDIKKVSENPEERALPENVYFLNERDILCTERVCGDSRFPYQMDGLNFWLNSSGKIYADEGNFMILKRFSPVDTPTVEFWGGIKEKDYYVPVSITGISKQMFEDVRRNVVFTPGAGYYIAETPKCIFTLRANITSKKQLNFTVSAINKTDDNLEVYLASYLAPVLIYMTYELMWAWDPAKRFSQILDNGSCIIKKIFDPAEKFSTNYGVITKCIKGANVLSDSTTAAQNDLLGGAGNSLNSASALKNGKFVKETKFVNHTDLAMYSNMVKFLVSPGDEVMINYTLSVTGDEEKALEYSNIAPNIDEIEADIDAQTAKDKESLDSYKVKFGNLALEGVNNSVFNCFIECIKKQAGICAFGKNYSGALLGVRDVFQQLTAALIFDSKTAREKIIAALNYIMDNGRPPRQFSVVDINKEIPVFDIRQFIDQGLWIIETVHKYLCTTNDYSILSEKCSYFHIIDEKSALYKKSDVTDTVLEHLIKITDYLVSNIDKDTGCLKILYGDWNDAVCGMGAPLDSSKEFGNGVSVMATLQMYKLLKEINEILEKVTGYTDKCAYYTNVRNGIAEGLEKYALQDDEGRTHIVHGWGDQRSYLVGSLCDTDGAKRFSINSYSFWAISDMLRRNPDIKKSILSAYDVLDSKFGIKTFEPYFPKDMEGVGRITNITPGTNENACTYIHATTFSIIALFIMGEEKKAWEQICKIIPLTHKKLNLSPYVMPNQYKFNEELGMDGESGVDWFTGSGAVLTRIIFEYVLGVQAQINGVKIVLPDFVPANEIDMNVNIKGIKLEYHYINEGRNSRQYFVNGKLRETYIDEMSGYKVLFIPEEAFTENIKIEIFD